MPKKLYNQTGLLKADGMTDKELQTLHELSPQFLAQCELLSSYGVPETIGIPDFNDNNTFSKTFEKIYHLLY